MKVIKINESVKSDMKELSIKFMDDIEKYIYGRERELIRESKEFNVEFEEDYSDGYHRGAEEYLKKISGDVVEYIWERYKEFSKESEKIN